MNMDRFFSVVIPTMWRSEKIRDMIPKYQSCDLIKEIIIIDNNPQNKMLFESDDKIIYHTEGKNIFVNPAWNIGYSYSNYELVLANDDILIEDVESILKTIQESDFDIVGVRMGPKSDLMGIEEIRNFPMNHYGSFLYVKNYVYIPEQIKIWFGDNILFNNNKKKGLLTNCGITSNESKTVNEFRFEVTDNILKKDTKLYNEMSKKQDKYNIIIRTSGRKNYFKNNIRSIKRFYSNAKLHITIDDVNDLEYVEKYLVGMDYQYYIINKETANRIAEKKKLNRRYFLYNYYFNVVKPFLNGWCQYLDDDDEMCITPDFNREETNIIHLYKGKLDFKIVPSDINYGKKPVLNDISTLCIIVHSSRVVDWVPNRGGDYDFITTLYSQNNVEWHPEILSKVQTSGNFGRRNDREDKVINGFYLNLRKRKDRKNKMESEILKTRHNISRFEAVNGDELKSLDGFKGTIKNSELKQYATYLSHLNILKTANKENWNEVLVLEDDITLSDDFDERLDFLLKELPEDWKIAYLGFNGQLNSEIGDVSRWVYSVKNVYGCFGMLINGSFLNELIEVVENNKVAIDEVIHKFIQPKYKCYSFIPFLLYVNDDYSDLWNKHRVIDVIKNLYRPTINKETVYVVGRKHPFSVSEVEEVTQVIEQVNIFINNNIKEDSGVSEVNYDIVNQILRNRGVKISNDVKKPVIQNKPTDRGQIHEMRKTSLSNQAKKLLNVKPTSQNASPHVFGGKTRQ
jgi:GR25 family glycosyltransferase involved in LPS biosynthesis